MSWHYLLNWRITFGSLVLITLVAVALFAPWLAPHDPLAQDLLYGSLPPSWANGGEVPFLLGTDTLGRDILSRLIFGARPAVENGDFSVRESARRPRAVHGDVTAADDAYSLS